MYKSFREINNNCSKYVINIKNGIDVDKNYNLLLSEFKPIIRKIINGLKYGGNIDRMDLEQEAAIALWKCCYTYDFENKKDTMFYTYYYGCALNALSRYIYEYQTMITTNHHEKERCAPLREFSKVFYEENGRYPVREEYIRCGFNKELVDRFCLYNENLYCINDDDYLEKIDNNVETVSPIELDLLVREKNESLYNAIDDLDCKYKDVIVFKFFHDMTDDEVSEKLDINERTVRKRKQKALAMMKDNLMEFE